MAKTLTATYDSEKTIESVMFDLVGTGIPHDNIEVDKEKHVLKVTIPKESESGVREILKRHEPKKLN